MCACGAVRPLWARAQVAQEFFKRRRAFRHFFHSPRQPSHAEVFWVRN